MKTRKNYLKNGEPIIKSKNYVTYLTRKDAVAAGHLGRRLRASIVKAHPKMETHIRNMSPKLMGSGKLIGEKNTKSVYSRKKQYIQTVRDKRTGRIRVIKHPQRSEK